MGFKIDFKMDDYFDIRPTTAEIEQYMSVDYAINESEYQKGNIDNCVWKKYKPTLAEVNSPTYREQEIRRVLKTGVWIAIKEELLWLPPNYYFALQYGKTGGEDLQFRLKRLKHVYFKLRARNNPNCKGTFTVKNRQDGETSIAISDGFWESLDMEDGQVGIQSKTRNDSINPCWKTMQTIWMNLPLWFKQIVFDGVQTNGQNIAETMRFTRSADEQRGIPAKNVLLAYYPAVYNAMDGKNNMRKCVLDEVLKWIECDFGDTLNNYSKFIMPGFERRGMFDIFSSPPEKDCKSFRDGYDLWLKSDPSKIGANGTTESRIHRYYSNPLEGIQGAYDKFGDADPEKIYDWIMAERKSVAKDKLLEEIRGFPLNDEEMWGSLEGGDFWDNTKGIKERQIYLLGTRYKNPVTKEPIKIFGNLEWKDGVQDNPAGVVFRPSDKEVFDVTDARIAITEMPSNRDPFTNIFKCPDVSEYVTGVDPFGKRHPTKKASNGAGIVYKYLDLTGTGKKNYPVALYVNRPFHENIFFEDMLRLCIFYKAPLQFENNHDKIGNYFVDRGYKDWVLPTIGEKKGSDKLGDAVTAKGMFMDEMVRLLNAETNLPLEGEQYRLDNLWFEEIATDMLKFNLKDTHENDATMAFGQSLVAATKLLFKKPRIKNGFNDVAFKFAY